MFCFLDCSGPVLCDQSEVQLTLPTSATVSEAMQATLDTLDLSDTYQEQDIQCAIVDITSRTRGG